MSEKRKLLTAIVPCYNEEEALPFFYAEISRVAAEMQAVDFEFLFINDGSKDGTLRILRELALKDKRVRYVSFSRNFGKESAMFAGFEHAKGDYIAVMDADLQDPPSLLPEMLGYIENEGYDSVATKRSTRKGEPVIRSFFARCFYKIINKISKTQMVSGARDYVLMKRRVMESILALPEYNRFTKGIYNWVGYNTKWISYENVQRVAGTTKWSFWKLFLYAIEGIVAFTTAPLAIASIVGILFCLISFIMIIVIIVKTLTLGDPTSGWPSLVCIIFFVSGIQLFCLGIIGEYLAKTYLETKKRPIYIIKETNMEKTK